MNASNDNSPAKGRRERPSGQGALRYVPTCRIVVALAETLPILDSEVTLIETYLPDMIGVIIANDN